MSSSSSTISSLVLLISLLDGEAHAKRAAFARLAFHPDAATVRLDNHTGLKHANTKPLLLRALKGAEQRVPKKRRAHPTPIVGDRETGAASGMLRANANAAFLPQGVARVKHQVRNDALDLF